MKQHIPNIITLSNLSCGFGSIICASHNNFEWSVYLIFIGLFFDFFDGFFARILGVSGELGKQLDSLSDMVTFGVAPGFLLFQFYNFLPFFEFEFQKSPLIPDYVFWYEGWHSTVVNYWPFIFFIVPVLSAVRLAKFNISTNQTDEFIGLPTPANAIFLSSIVYICLINKDLIGSNGSTIQIGYILMIASIVTSLLLVSKIPLLALKFKSFKWNQNEFKFIFLGLSLLVILGTLLITNLMVSIPIIILLYLIISVVKNLTTKAK